LTPIFIFGIEILEANSKVIQEGRLPVEDQIFWAVNTGVRMPGKADDADLIYGHNQKAMPLVLTCAMNGLPSTEEMQAANDAQA